MRGIVSAISPRARAARARYGPDGEAVARLLTILSQLPRPEWERLVAANDQAERAWPPDIESAPAGADVMARASNDASTIALTVVGPAAADAWRRGLLNAGRARRGKQVDPPAPDEWSLADLAWRYQFVAQHMACLLVISAARGVDATKRDWAPYAAVVSIDSVL